MLHTPWVRAATGKGTSGSRGQMVGGNGLGVQAPGRSRQQGTSCSGRQVRAGNGGRGPGTSGVQWLVGRQQDAMVSGTEV